VAAAVAAAFGGLEVSYVAIEMRVLLFSTVVYLAGIATVLFLRPALMFDRDGRWKEFGIRGDDATVFPFWSFCIGWAAVSYLVAGLLTSEEGGSLPALTPANWVGTASKAASLTTAASGLYRGFRGARDEEEEDAATPPSSPLPSNAVMPLPVSGPKRGGGRKSSKSSKSSRGPPPKGYYLYVGGDPPAAAAADSDSSDAEE
jgi:hypothetical protein